MATIHSKPLTAKTREAVWHQRNADRQRSDKIIESPDIRPEQTRQGTVLFLKRIGGKGGGTKIKRLKITSIHHTYLGCRAFDADALTAEVWVAKNGSTVGDTPTATLLEPTASNQKTTHIAGSSTVDLIQTLLPPYAVGGTVYVAMDVVGGTAQNTDVAPIEEIKHLELSPTREWADPLNAYCVLVNGVKKQAYFRSSSPF